MNEQLLQRTRSTVLGCDSLVEWSLVGLLAGVDVLLFAAKSRHRRPRGVDLREALISADHEIRLDHHALTDESTTKHRSTYLPGEVPGPQLLRTSLGLDELVHALGASSRDYDAIGVAIDASALASSESDGTAPSSPISTAGELVHCRRLVTAVPIHPAVRSFAAQLIEATVPRDEPTPNRARELFQRGASPSVVDLLLRIAQARAFLYGRSQVEFDDVVTSLTPALRHRVVRSVEAISRDIAIERLIAAIVRSVPAPELHTLSEVAAEENASLSPNELSQSEVRMEPDRPPVDKPPANTTARRPSFDCDNFVLPEMPAEFRDAPASKPAPQPAPQYVAPVPTYSPQYAPSTSVPQNPAYVPAPMQPTPAPMEPSQPLPRRGSFPLRFPTRRPSLILTLISIAVGGAIGLSVGFQVLCNLYPEHYHWPEWVIQVAARWGWNL